MKGLKPSYALFSVATPYPGTEFYTKIREAGKVQGDWSHYDLLTPVVETMNLTLEEIKSLQKKAFREFYLRPAYLFQSLTREGLSFFKVVKAAIST